MYLQQTEGRLMKVLALGSSGLGLAVGAVLLTGMTTAAVAQEPTLSPQAKDHSKNVYFQRCAGCHGVLR